MRYMCPRCTAVVEGTGGPDMRCPRCSYPDAAWTPLPAAPRHGEEPPPIPPGAPQTPEASAPATQWPPPLQPPGDDRTAALLAHLLGLLVGVLQFPFGFVAPMVVYLLKRRENRFASEHARAALNWHLTLIVAAVVVSVLLYASFRAWYSWGLAPLPRTSILDTVWYAGMVKVAGYALMVGFGVTGCLRANQGQPYAYPLAIPFVGPRNPSP